MKIISRIVTLIIVFFVFLATFFFSFWVSAALIFGAMGESIRLVVGIALLISLICALVVGWKTWTKLSTWHRGLNICFSMNSCIFIGAILIGSIGFLLGFFGPIIFTPQANQGPLLGLFVTGPISFLLGGVGGYLYWLFKKRKT